jgi:hypothetical protein
MKTLAEFVRVLADGQSIKTAFVGTFGARLR